MRPDARDAAYLWDMRESARDAVRILGDLDLRAFLRPENETVRLAVERKLEVLGEAASTTHWRTCSPRRRETFW
jgi:uncharacterized protein with HEPN domain